MKWTELIDRVAERSGTSKDGTRRVLNALLKVVYEALVSGEEVPLRGLVVISSRWQDARTVRAIRDRRKMVLDGRYIPQFRTSRRLKEGLTNRTPQHWRDPQHQDAWRVAEALVGDVALYHEDQAPKHLSPNAPMAQVEGACREAFGTLWEQVTRSYQRRVPEKIRSQRDHLLMVARRQWAMAAD